MAMIDLNQLLEDPINKTNAIKETAFGASCHCSEHHMAGSWEPV